VTSRKPVATNVQSHAAYITSLLDRVERGEITNAFTKMLQDLQTELYSQAIDRARGKPAVWLGVTRLKMCEQLKEFGLDGKVNPADALEIDFIF
jgi:hypothetical protein